MILRSLCRHLFLHFSGPLEKSAKLKRSMYLVYSFDFPVFVVFYDLVLPDYYSVFVYFLFIYKSCRRHE